MKQNIVQYIMIVFLVVGAYMVGVYKTENAFLKKVSTDQTTKVQGQETQPTQPLPKTTLSTDDLKVIDGLFKDSKSLVFGNKKAKIRFVQLSDPSCPYCHVAGGENSELNKKLGERFILAQDGGEYVAPVLEIKKLVDQGKAGFVWLYTPGHGSGEMATLALYCANEKNKFWEVQSKLMSNEGYELMNNTVKNDIKQAGTLAQFLASAIDVNFMQSCLESDKYSDRMSANQAVAKKLGHASTPTFFINDQVVKGALSWDKGFKVIVESLLSN